MEVMKKMADFIHPEQKPGEINLGNLELNLEEK
jgi:hypothetical protein